MQCDVCQQKEATVFLTQIVGGKMQKVNLCEACSKEKGVNDPTGFALADLLLGMGAAQDIERSPNGITCPVCGFTQADFKKTGRLGCSACYDVFGDSLESMLKNMHKGPSMSERRLPRSCETGNWMPASSTCKPVSNEPSPMRSTRKPPICAIRSDG